MRLLLKKIPLLAMLFLLPIVGVRTSVNFVAKVTARRYSPNSKTTRMCSYVLAVTSELGAFFGDKNYTPREEEPRSTNATYQIQVFEWPTSMFGSE
eukprot:2660687-Amphidinium_carterae.1